MGRIIRRTVTITITETWTIIWTDDVQADDKPPPQATTIVRAQPSTTFNSEGEFQMENLIGESTDSSVAAVKGENTGSGGFGVWGICATGHGVHGQSTTSKGVVGESEGFHGVFGKSRDNVGVAAESQNAEAMNAQNFSGNHAAIIAVNHANGVGIQGRADGNVGVFGESNTSRGVRGTSNTHIGVSGDSQRRPGVRGTSVEGPGTKGFSKTTDGVFGLSDTGIGVHGKSDSNVGIVGESNTGRGLHGVSNTNFGVSGDSRTFAGVRGTSVEGTGTEGWSTSGTGVFATSQSGFAIHGKGGRLAGCFEGDVEVTGELRLTNADCAEDFDIFGADKVEPGTVMILGSEGALSASQQAYDKRVAGVISGAGNYKPGIVLDKQQTAGNRQPIALMGKVFCKVDAQFGAIEVGDLLTTSPTPGHAMRTSDPFKAFGAVIGKALRPLTAGQGLIPILVALQ